ncbi:MAG: hypothetical protein KBG48_04055 [Kofleriaceae bacterium]|nr:hypothetical protein [Kofleriaceae bacterium]MBP9166531.1 hypothetical protein [Kofleriaceae bacterium]MBP9859433.1 hypothetical protein [Kofleriaceae bacterium]
MTRSSSEVLDQAPPDVGAIELGPDLHQPLQIDAVLAAEEQQLEDSDALSRQEPGVAIVEAAANPRPSGLVREVDAGREDVERVQRGPARDEHPAVLGLAASDRAIDHRADRLDRVEDRIDLGLATGSILSAKGVVPPAAALDRRHFSSEVSQLLVLHRSTRARVHAAVRTG